MKIDDAHRIIAMEHARICRIAPAHCRLERWKFRWIKTRRIGGRCYILLRIIEISQPVVEANDESVLLEIVRHELAHAIAGTARHDHGWKMVAKFLGLEKPTTHIGMQLPYSQGDWILKCHRCGREWRVLGKPRRRRSCVVCSGARRFNPEYTLGVMRVGQGDRIEAGS